MHKRAFTHSSYVPVWVYTPALKTASTHLFMPAICIVCAAAGFCTGYVDAIKGSVRLVSGVSMRVASKAAVVAARLFRRCIRVMLRV
jgi:hypothetical protein